MDLKRFKDFINEDYDYDYDEDDLHDWDGIVRHDGNKELYRVDSRRTTYLYDAHGDVTLKHDEDTAYGKIVYQFVDDFSYEIKAEKIGLVSLEGFPLNSASDVRVDGNKLTDLKGAPKSVDSIFSCDNNPLTSLEGAPEEVEEFYALHCNQLTDLKGAPKHVANMFDVSYCKNLTSLEGAPEHLHHIDLIGCEKLTSLKGLPKRIGGALDIKKTGIYSLIDLIGIDMGDTLYFSDSKVTEIEFDYYIQDGQYGSKEDYYPDFFKFIARNANRYKNPMIDKIIIPEEYFNGLDDPKMKNFFRSAKTTSKFNL
jgi:hypothetical protein